MANIDKMRQQEEIYYSRLRELVKDHPRQYFLIEENLTFSIFKTENELEKATSKYEGYYGPTVMSGRIPKRLSKKDREKIGEVSLAKVLDSALT